MFDPMSGVILSRASLIPLDNSLGAWLIGLIVSSVIFGVTCFQVYLYFTKHCARDLVFLKTYVALLLALDVFNLALVSHGFYFLTVTNFGDYLELGTAPWSLLVQIAVGGMKVWSWMPTHFVDFLLVLLAALVQLFYAFRIYTLSNKSLVLPVIIVGDPLDVDSPELIWHQGVLAFADLMLSIASVHKRFIDSISFQVKYFSLAREVVPEFAGSLSIKVACDVRIAGAMVYHLLRNKTGFHK
ncbi:hypothetical protein B0H14DRAFT_3123581 [Mycena olivaceomarginata]|nr:hypothetical protein B0H14DRAFT_3123581 [Mycena olivaceomarginata]